MPRYSTALSYAVLSAVSLWSLITYNNQAGGKLNAGYLTFGLTFADSILGLIKCVQDEQYNLERFSRNINNVQMAFALPAFTCQIYLLYKQDEMLTYSHLIVSLVYIFTDMINLFDRIEKSDILNFLLLLNLLSLSYMSHINMNYYGIAAVVSFAFIQFFVGNKYTIWEYPAVDFYNYGLCFFVYFAIKALCD